MVKKNLFFGARVIFRLDIIQKIEIDNLVKENQHLYNSPSHFVRCAVIKLLNEHKSMSFKDLEAYQRSNERLLVYGKKNKRW